METTLFLAKVFGLYLLIVGLHLPLRRRELGALFASFVENRALVYLASVLALILGLLLVVGHNLWVAGWPVIVTLLSWLVLLKALAGLLLPHEATAAWVRRFNGPAWFVVGGPLWAALGLFLLGKGAQVF